MKVGPKLTVMAANQIMTIPKSTQCGASNSLAPTCSPPPLLPLLPPPPPNMSSQVSANSSAAAAAMAAAAASHPPLSCQNRRAHKEELLLERKFRELGQMSCVLVVDRLCAYSAIQAANSGYTRERERKREQASHYTHNPLNATNHKRSLSQSLCRRI